MSTSTETSAETSVESSVEALDARREEAILASGWGAHIRLFQPRNLAFWVWAVLVGWGFVSWVLDTAHAATYYAPAITLAFLVFALYGALFWWFTQHIDRYASQPSRLRAAAFLWGAFAATWVMAAPGNDALFPLYSKLFGQTFALNWGHSFAVPVTEEWSKGFGLILLVAIAPRVVRTAYDGFILGAFIGLGFQILEDISYIESAATTSFGADQVRSTLVTFAMRTGTGIAGHILFTAIFCTGLVYLMGLPEQPRRILRGLVLVLVAMGIHFVWDAQTPLAKGLLGETAGGLAVALLIPALPIVALLVCVRVFHVAVRGERAFMRDMLAPEVARGVVTEAEVAAAAGSRKDRRRYRVSEGGRGHRRRNRHVLDSVFDLARELGQSRGASTERVDYARSEVIRLRSSA